MRNKLLLLLIVLSSMALEARADDTIGLTAGINGVFFNNEASPSDIEVGVATQLGVTTHISLPAQLWFGLGVDGEQYTRGTGGFQITATDANRKDFSAGLGGEYQLASGVRHEGWRWTSNIGFRPTQKWPRVLATVKAAVNTKLEESEVIGGLRYRIGGNP